MADLIDKYFVEHLSLSWDEAVRLHKEYYQNYGLAIEGLVRHHKIDPLEYNTKVDDALPLDGVIKPRPELHKLLQDIDRSKVRLWLLTNAYVTHGKRVIRLLEVEEHFEGITYCDYRSMPLVCKPHVDMYHKAMKEAGVNRVEDCFFVGRYQHRLASQEDTDLLCRRFVQQLCGLPGSRLVHRSSRRRRRAHTRDTGIQVPNKTPR